MNTEGIIQPLREALRGLRVLRGSIGATQYIVYTLTTEHHLQVTYS
ncbi:MAG: hypothetical protein KDD55_07190 [Bdellovibrionales bacterium]|nr:hypothetical protein [Bdellovibrionales bacterium]